MAKINPLPSQQYLRECLIYDPDTGILTAAPRPLQHFKDASAWKSWNSRFCGKTYRTPDRWGYIIVTIGEIRYRASRLIWKLQTGRDPHPEVDHRNLNPSDDRWENLREATSWQQKANHRIRRDSGTGLKGVAKHREHFRASIRIHGKQRHLGCFAAIEDAYEAYCAAARLEFGEFWHP